MTAGVGTGLAPTPPPHPRRSARVRGRLLLLAFLAPALLLFTGFVLYPIATALRLGLYEWSGLGPPTDFIGLDNFRRAVTEPVFHQAVGHTVLFVAVAVALQVPAGLAVALLLRRGLPGRRWFRLALFLPFVLSDVVAAQIWNFLYQPQFGVVDALLGRVDERFAFTDWLGRDDLVLWAIVLVTTWKYLGFSMTLFIAGLNQIPAEVEEAALLDGANAWQTFRYVVAPMLGPTTRLVIYLSVLGSLQMFELVFVMTGGGPAHASETITTYMYNYGFKTFQLGYGNAVALLLFVVCFAFSIGYQRFAFRRDFGQEVAARG